MKHVAVLRHGTPRDRDVLGLEHPMKFFRGRRAVSSVLSKNQKVRDAFDAAYGDKFSRVFQYYEYRRERVQIVDLASVVPVIEEVFG